MSTASLPIQHGSLIWCCLLSSPSLPFPSLLVSSPYFSSSPRRLLSFYVALFCLLHIVRTYIRYTGFAVGVPVSLLLLPDEPRIALASGIAFLCAQLLDVATFDALRGHRVWWVPPLCSSVMASVLDSALFGVVAFYGTEMPTENWPLVGDVPHWVTWGVGDCVVKSSFAIANLLPFRLIGGAAAATTGAVPVDVNKT